MIAYCWRGGEIGFTEGTVPDGALPIRNWPDEVALKDAIAALATLGWESNLFIVPGVREAGDDEEEAARAMATFCNRLENILN